MEERTDGSAGEDIRGSEFNQEVRARRAAAGVAPDDPLTWGLALSGGGIRSATFCFGLLRALAKNGLLKRFDYLSTVSGGGYIGSMLGRLYRADTPAPAVEQGLGSDESLLLWWLRNNGRYLTPAGAKDLATAAASVFRGTLSTHFEVAVMILLAACLLTLPHALLPVLPERLQVWMNGFMWLWSSLPSAWWWLAPLPLFAASASAWAFWQARDEGNCGCPRCRALLAAVAALAAVVLVGCWSARQLSAGIPSARALAGFGLVGLLLAAVAGSLLRLALYLRHRTPPEVRLIVTRWMRNGLVLSLLLFAAGVLDALAFLLFHELHDLTVTGAVGVSGLTAAALPLLRLVGKKIHDGAARPDGATPQGMSMANAAGILLLVLLVLAWTTLLMAFVFASSEAAPEKLIWLPLLRLGGVSAALAFYALLSGCNLSQLNLASLHYLYFARLARAYVSVGNVRDDKHHGRFPHSPLQAVRRDDIAAIARLEDAVPGDDPPLVQYAPHQFGGPIHLVNCCINQTRDDRTGAYNADRKGIALTVSARGLETGTHGPQPHQALQDTTLGQWATISGAALASGMGSKTAPGVAALLFLTGLRLGFWFPSAAWARANSRAGWLAKYRATLAELFAAFPGLRDRHWYLSDGGFFDNTGVYALLKRRVDLIVLADCGEDHDYLFGDLENLVRKARIDYAAEIEFLDPNTLDAAQGEDWGALIGHAGTPLTITPEPGPRYLLVGRIRYDDGRVGTLLVVKPHRTNDLPLDVVGYADGQPAFPQQSTGNQFFDEAQWESYHSLGLHLGQVLDDKLLDSARQWSRTQTAAAAFKTMGAAKTPTEEEAAAQRRQRVGQTVRTSLGAGIGFTVALGLWQVFEDYRKDRDTQRTAFLGTYEETMKAVSAETDDLLLDARLQSFSDSMGGLGIIQLTKDADTHVIAAVQARCDKDEDQLPRTCDNYRGYLRQSTPTHAVWADYWKGTIASQWDAASSAANQAEAGAAAPMIVAMSEPAGTEAPVGVTASETPAPAPVNVAPQAGAPPPPAAGPPPIPVAPPAVRAAPPPAHAAPPPSALPAPAGSGAAAPASAVLTAACTPRAWGPVQLYSQIFSEAARSRAADFGKLAAEGGVVAAGIENVTASAARNNSAPPIPWPRPTFIYHTPAEQPCAQALAQVYDAFTHRGDSMTRPLPRKLRATPGVIELWLPPATDTSAN